MRFAREEDSQEIYELYQKNRKIFPNITMGHITNRIKKREEIINQYLELKEIVNFYLITLYSLYL